MGPIFSNRLFYPWSVTGLTEWQLLEAKALMYGRTVNVLSTWEPTSQRCSACGQLGGKSPWPSGHGRACTAAQHTTGTSTPQTTSPPLDRWRRKTDLEPGVRRVRPQQAGKRQPVRRANSHVCSDWESPALRPGRMSNSSNVPLQADSVAAVWAGLGAAASPGGLIGSRCSVLAPCWTPSSSRLRAGCSSSRHPVAILFTLPSIFYAMLSNTFFGALVAAI